MYAEPLSSTPRPKLSSLSSVCTQSYLGQGGFKEGDPNLSPSSPTWLAMGCTWKLVFLRKKPHAFPYSIIYPNSAEQSEVLALFWESSLGDAAAQPDSGLRRCCEPRVTGKALVRRSRCFSKTRGAREVTQLEGTTTPWSPRGGRTTESKSSGPAKQMGTGGNRGMKAQA